MTIVIKNAGAGKRSAQKARVYALMKVAEGHARSVASILRRKPGVVMADVLESQSDVIMVVEAEERQRLARLTVQALASVEMLTDGMHLMPTEEQRISMAFKPK